MTSWSTVFRIGTRSSSLARIQAAHALDLLQRRLPECIFELTPFDSPGDRDRKTDLRESAPDFFTRDLDQAVRDGEIDAALHSAKDVPMPVSKGLDWVWLPWGAEPRDAVVLAPGVKLADLPSPPRVGVSSDRRADYCARTFPGAVQLPVRGNIEHRLEQLDRGDFDLLVMAAAALHRLGLHDRVTQLIPLYELPVPEGQGRLCITFRQGDQRWHVIRTLLVHAVQFVGAGVGDARHATTAALDALTNCTLCLHDTLMDQRLLEHLPAEARVIHVGKRAGKHNRPQAGINQLLADAARKGHRVVRLKGGDPTIFGRLAEELDTLAALALPSQVVPGLSALNTLAAGSGILLTQRGVSNGFTTLTPRRAGGGLADIGTTERAALPVVAYMATKACAHVCADLQADGWPDETPATMVYGAGSTHEFSVRGTVATLPVLVAKTNTSLPGLLVVGAPAAGEPSTNGALAGKRVLLTCSKTLQKRAALCVRDFGGIPLPRPLIRLEPSAECLPWLREATQFDWLILTSPSAVRCLIALMADNSIDLRDLPHLAVCGLRTGDELRRHGLLPTLEPRTDYSADSMLALFRERVNAPTRILRLRSDRAGESLAESLRALKHEVQDAVLYENLRVETTEPLPNFDAVLFASSSAVDAYAAIYGTDMLAECVVATIGEPTAKRLVAHGRSVDVRAIEATVESCVESLAGWHVRQRLADM